MPFAVLLLAIAVLPLTAARFWESNFRKLAVSAVLGLPVLVLYLRHHPPALLHAGLDYLSFMVLLGSLFVISGGVLLDGDLPATPRTNTLFLAVGALFASLVGTTGASMLLIRPLLRTNSERKHVTHTVVFFIFLVSNIGGCLTPLGDPPLFLGYLQGVPFAWTLRLAPAWALTTGLVLLIYYAWDRRAYARESVADRRVDRLAVRPLRVAGRENLLLLLGIVLAAALLHAPWREVAMVGLALASLGRTDPELRRANHFSFHPILEVAAVFAGIFLTMLPALDLLRARGAALGVREPWQFFWATGALSSFLDNAPTYVVFLETAAAMTPDDAPGILKFVDGTTIFPSYLTAISLGAVFMGANTYIGNGPNFMVKSIAEQAGVKMPSFFGYMLYSVGILIPLFLLITVVFFS
jgi:Na+/H+ antiporter NhaD/arsenite permease-like protein